jgi:hypothetical protein
MSMSRALSLLAVLSLAALTSSAIAAEKAAKKDVGKEVVAASKTLKAGEKDPNVKSLGGKNDHSKVPDAPPDKGGKSRGPGPWGCRVVIDNWTGYIVQTFVDGDFVGNVSRFGDGSVVVGNGATLLYARAEFTDGSSLFWGPQAVECPAGGRYRWKLTP